MIIYLVPMLPPVSSDLPESTTGRRIAFCSVLLRMGFTYAPPVTRRAVVSYTALPTLPGMLPAVHFCCTILGVTSTGRYPASCPMKPGLSSDGTFRPAARDHLFCFTSGILAYLHGKCKQYFTPVPFSYTRPTAGYPGNPHCSIHRPNCHSQRAHSRPAAFHSASR